MPSIVSILFATVYVLGAVLHYLHVYSVLQLTDNMDKSNHKKIMWNTAIWPITVVGYLWNIFTTDLEEEDE